MTSRRGWWRGNQINLAMERGEVEARHNTWSGWKATKAAWLAENKIAVIAQAGPRASDLDAPSVEQLARNPDERQTACRRAGAVLSASP